MEVNSIGTLKAGKGHCRGKGVVEVKVSLVPTEQMPLRLGVAAGTCPSLNCSPFLTWI